MKTDKPIKMKKKKGKTSSVSKKEAFLKKLLDYYKNSLLNLASSVDQLGKIQKEHPSEYELFRKTPREPDMILQLMDKLPDKDKTVLFELFVKSANLSSRTRIMHELTSKEKKILAKDLRAFSKEISNKIKKVKKK